MIETSTPAIRENCWSCYRALSLCLCTEITPFETKPLIGLLIHPKEFRKTVGTARIVKRSIRNSLHWTGHGADFDQNERFLSVILNPDYYPVVLYPGPNSANISALTETELKTRIPQHRRLLILVIDGTWPNARKMIRTSQILRSLPQMSFDVKTESTYGFRKQPHSFCLSTVEAVFQLIDNLYQKGLCPLPSPRVHHSMLAAFHALVQSQSKFKGGDGWKIRKGATSSS